VTTLFSFVFVLGVLIFVHELGHFMMARRIGVRVLTFSLGFGPKLLKVRRGDTEYCISAIPLGGYVKMAGENPEDTRTGAPDEFLSKSKWQRFQVLVMGPVMNLALAILVMWVVLFQGAQVAAFDRQPVMVGGFTATSVAKTSGIQLDDHVVSVDGKPVATWEDFSLQIVSKAGRSVTLGVERGGKLVNVTVVPASIGKFEMGDIGILPEMHPEVLSIEPDKPALAAGLQVGDVVLGANAERNLTRDRLIEIIKAHDGQPVVLEVRRAGETRNVTVTPRRVGAYAIIGASLSPYEVRTIDPGPLEALNLSVQRNWEWAKLIVQTLGGLFTRETSVKQLMGPVAIAEVSGVAAEQGWLALFSLMAMISLNLGLLNLMPIPVLDGGHIAILAMEGLSRRDFSMKVKEKMLLAGFVLLLALMVTVIYNDLTRVQWIEKLMPWR